MSLAEKDNELIQAFSDMNSWEDRYSKIIKIGKASPGMSDSEKLDDLKVSGCQSQVWIKAHRDKEGRLHFQADSDALIVKGLVSILAKLFSAETPKDILEYQPQFIEKIGLRQNLSPSRANGLMNMLKQIKYYAIAYQASSKVE